MGELVYLGLRPGLYSYWPELGEQKPPAQIEAKMSYYGTHWYLDTPFELTGRGIKYFGKHPENSKNPGWNHYKVTNRAFEQLKQQYAISELCHLD